MLLYACNTSETFIMILYFLGKTMDFNCVICRKFISILSNELNKRIEIDIQCVPYMPILRI